MVLGIDLGAATTPWLLGGLLGVLTAAWVLRVNSKSLMNKSLAFYLFVQGGLSVAVGLEHNTGSRSAPEAAVPVLTILSLAAAWSFWWIHRSWPLFTDNVLRRFQMLLLAGAILSGFYLSNRHWWSDGPLQMATGFLALSQALIAFSFVAQYRRLRTGPQRRSTLLMGVAFGLPALYVGLASLATTAADPIPVALYERIAWALVVAATVPALAGLTGLLLAWIRPKDGDMKAELAPALYACLLPLLLVISLALVVLGEGNRTAAHAMFAGLWVAPHAMIVAFALTRLQVVDMSEKLRAVIKQFVRAVMFFVIFFSVSEGLEGFVGAQFGSIAGLGAAAILTFALAPLQRLADRIADVALPSSTPIHERSPEERAIYYREQVRLAWEDGELGRKERDYLNGLQRTLQLDPNVIAAIEYDEAPEYARRNLGLSRQAKPGPVAAKPASRGPAVVIGRGDS